MKKGLLFAVAMGAVVLSGCGPFCSSETKKDGKDAKTEKKVETTKESKKVETKDISAEH
ncbi:MAG: hypothetical protein QG632_540 [Candidatus Dependentiae bacterium]|nr:hypothetical protein [Candidatus Dependentiae bacterium]